MLDTLVADLTDLRLWMIVILVTVIGLLEKLAIYRAGQRSVETELSDVLGYNQERQARYEELFRTRGAYILLLASIPGIGAAMSAVAGFVSVALAPFVIWVTISNLIRNWLIVLFTGQLASLF
jgi:membrane protein DedA with SNARE-associated domain